MNQHGILTYVKIALAFPYNKTIRWTHGKKASWVIFEIYSPSTLQSNTLNIRRDFACRVMLGISAPSTLPDKRFKIWRKLPCAVIFEIYISSTLPSTPFNEWTNLACWVIVKDLLPCALQIHVQSRSTNRPVLASWAVFNMSFPMQIRTLNIGTKLKP